MNSDQPTQPATNPGKNQLLQLGMWLLRLGLPALGVWYVASRIDPHALLRAAARFSPWMLALALVYTGCMYLAPALRMRFLSHNALNRATAYRALILCLGVNNLVPARLGELTKLAYLRTRGGLSLEHASTVVFWESFLDLNALGACALMSFAVLGEGALPLPLFALLLLIWAGLGLCIAREDIGGRLVSALPLGRFRPLAADALARLRRQSSPGFLAAGAAWTVFFWMLGLGHFALVLNGIAHLNLGIFQLLSVFMAGVFAANMPSSPGALGVFEAAMVAALTWNGVEPEAAVAGTLVLRVFQYLPSTLAALWIMGREGIRPSRLRSSQA